MSLKIGTVPSASIPIRVKVMKARVVNVSVWPLTRPGFDETDPPSNLPALRSEQDMEDYLNGVFQKQIAVTFNVIPKDESEMAANPGQYFDPLTVPLTTFDAIAAGKTEGHIQVFVTGGYPIVGIPDPVLGGSPEGWTPTGGNQIWLPVGPLIGGDAAGKERWLANLAHETGHVLWGPGHPNAKVGFGRAALPGTDRSLRLMYTHQGGTPPKLIVKAEWDFAEVWLNTNVN